MLADFIVECTIPNDVPDTQHQSTSDGTSLPIRPWILHVDGSSTPSTSGVRIILTSPMREMIEYALHFIFFASNNEAEYEALFIGLKLVRELGVSEVRVFSDLPLIVGQVRGELEA